MRLACLVLALAAPPLAAEPLRIGTEPDYPPYMFLDAAGNYTGFDKELGDALCAQGGFDCAWVPMVFNELIPAIQAGRIDIAISGMAASPGRAEVVDFSRPYRPTMPAAGAFAALVPGLSARGLLAGVQDGTVQAEFLAATDHPHLTYTDTAAMLAALRAGEVQVIFGSAGGIEEIIERTAPGLRVVETVEVPSYGTAIAISRSHAGLKDRIDTILTTLEQNGLLGRLELRWFPDGQDL